MKIQIKHRYTGSILFEGKFGSLGLCVEAAVAQDANLGGAYLGGANLRGANLGGANLGGANLRGANLGGAYLRGANLRGAYLRGANLRGAYLGGAYLGGAKNIELPHFQIIPTEGAFIGWKTVKIPEGKAIAKLEIPSKAKRTSALAGRKCRASYVKVLEIQTPEGKPLPKNTVGRNGTARTPAEYKVGRLTKADKWDDTPFEECTHGIHFFVTREEAVEWL